MSEVPSVDDLLGVDPDRTGGLSTDEYIALTRAPGGASDQLIARHYGLVPGRRVIARGAPGKVVSPPGQDGRVFVRRDDGTAAPFPVADVTPVSDKDYPVDGMETK
jgi:hypothetical protein